jgi:MFS family permease
MSLRLKSRLWTNRIPWLLLPGLVIVAGLVWATVAFPYPPFQDFNETAYQAFIAKLTVLGKLPETVCIQEKPIPNASATLILSVLMFLFSPLQASRIFLSIYIVMAATIAIQLARRKQTEGRWAGTAVLILAVVFVGPAFWSGYINYLIGLLLLGAYLCLSDERQASPVWIVPFTIAAFFCHALVFLPLCGLAALHLIARRRWLALVLSLTPCAVLVLFYELLPGYAEHHNDTPFSLAKLAVYKAYTAFKAGPYHNFVFANGGDYENARWLYYLGVFANVAFGTALMVALGIGLHAALKRSGITVHTLCFIALIVVFLALPNMAMAVVNPGERFWYPAVLIGIATFPLPPRLVTGLAIASALVIVSISRLPAGDFATQVHEDAMQDRERVFFSHRPTAFVNKVVAMEQTASSGRTPAEPIDFQTGLFFRADPVRGCLRN